MSEGVEEDACWILFGDDACEHDPPMKHRFIRQVEFRISERPGKVVYQFEEGDSVVAIDSDDPMFLSLIFHLVQRQLALLFVNPDLGRATFKINGNVSSQDDLYQLWDSLSDSAISLVHKAKAAEAK